jgi:hypothetical protein
MYIYYLNIYVDLVVDFKNILLYDWKLSWYWVESGDQAKEMEAICGGRALGQM